METAEAVTLKLHARRIALRRQGSRRPWETLHQPGMTHDVGLTFDPIDEGGRPVCERKIMPATVLNRGGRIRGALGSMVDEADVSTPERVLMAAVLREAVKDGDTAWATDEEDESLFSVTNICDTLGLSVDAVRKATGG